MYREIVEKDIRNRGGIIEAGKIQPVPTDHLRYASLFMFGPDILAHVKTNGGSVKEFKGKVFCEAIWIDIDCDGDVNEARLSTIELVKRLNTEYQFNPEHLYYFFSGKKGFHICIHCSFVGFQSTTPLDTDKVKDFVRRLTKGIPHIDLKVYEPVRIFRVENSRHEKSGLYKIRISFEELQCEMEDVLNLAKQPRVYPYKHSYAGAVLNKGLNTLWQNSGEYVQEQKEMEYKGNLFAPPTEGNRNQTLFVQACTLFRKSELSSNAILDIIGNAAYIANIGAKEPVDQNEVRRIVVNAQKKVGEDRKKTVDEEIEIKSFGEWIPDWERYVMEQQSEMSLLFQDVNHTVKGRLRGKLGVVMGYGGSKKSLYALNVCLRNKRLNDEISIYSTMEMSVPQLMNRVIDHEVYVDGSNMHASEYLADTYRKDINQGRRFLVDQLSKEMGNRLQLTPKGRMTYDHYKKAIHKVRETAGNPTILIVDGLSMMGGKGTETEMYSRNTAELKELANEENIFIMLICHVSKGGEKHTRDLSRYIRGSEKILDNCDWYMSMSQIQYEDQADKYRTDIGFVNFVDKRGSGNAIDLIYNFEPLRLRLSDSNLNPDDYRDAIDSKKSKVIDF